MSQVSFSLKTLCIACMVASCPHVFALEAISEKEMSEATGEGLAYFAENFSIKMGQADYIKMTSTGGGASETGTKAETYLYNFQFGGTDSNNTTGRNVVKASNIGSASNPAILKVYKSAAVPVFDPDAGGGTGKESVDVFQIAMPKRPDNASDYSNSENLKWSTWVDVIARDGVDYYKGASNDYENDANNQPNFSRNRLRAQIIADKTSVDGSFFQLWKGKPYPYEDYRLIIQETNNATNGGILGTRTFSRNVSDNASKTSTMTTQPIKLLDGTGVSTQYLLRSEHDNKVISRSGLRISDGGNDNGHNRYETTADGHWGPVYWLWDNNNEQTRENRAHNAARQQAILDFSKLYVNELNRMSIAYDGKVGLSGVIRSNMAEDGVFRVSVAQLGTEEPLPSSNIQGNSKNAGFGDIPISRGNNATFPNFNSQEGIYFKNFDNNMPLGILGYQPSYISSGGKSGRELVIEVARLPNNPAAYNNAYINYETNKFTGYAANGEPIYENTVTKEFTNYNADGTAQYGSAIAGLTEVAGTCTPTSCPTTATHATLRHQLFTKDKNGNFEDVNANYYGLGLGDIKIPAGNTTLIKGSAGITTTGLQELNRLPASVTTNQGTYNALDGMYIQHLKLTTKAFD